AYSTSIGPTGPWKYGNVIMEVIKSHGAFTNHPGYIDFLGKSYLFYHDAGLAGGGGFKRSVCVEPFTFNPDGTIPLILPTKNGVTQSAKNLNPFQRVEAETIAWAEGVKTEKDSVSGEVFLTQINDNDYIKIRSVDFQHGTRQFETRVKALISDASIEIRIDSIGGPILGKLEVGSDSKTQKWKTKECKLTNTKGIHDLYLVFKGKKGELMNFDWWRIR
ncbi:MAG: carbohydrate-binding protein, partial [Pedobacter sp.]